MRNINWKVSKHCIHCWWSLNRNNPVVIIDSARFVVIGTLRFIVFADNIFWLSIYDAPWHNNLIEHYNFKTAIHIFVYLIWSEIALCFRWNPEYLFLKVQLFALTTTEKWSYITILIYISGYPFVVNTGNWLVNIEYSSTSSPIYWA